MLLTPVQLVCARFGNGMILAKLLNVHYTTVYNWQSRRGGAIPDVYFQKILKLARMQDIKLTSAELVDGGKL